MVLRLAAAFILGCGTVLLWPQTPPLALALVPLALALVPRLRAPALALLMGGFGAEVQLRSSLADQWPVERHGEEIELRGRVVSLPERREGEGGLQWRFAFAPDAVARAGGLPRVVRVSWYRSEAQIAAGDCWVLRLRLRSPRGSHVPGTFDYEGWLFREGYGATASVRQGQPCAAGEDGLGVRVLQLRAGMMARVEALLGEHPGLPLLAALSVGDSRGLDDHHWSLLRQTGTSHLVVISGLHLAFMSLLGYALVRAVWPLLPGAALRCPTPWAAGIGAALFATAYAVLAGLQTPVLRALLMVWLGLLLAWRGGWRQPYAALTFIAAVVVALDPRVLLRPGFWLSFGAVAAIIHLSAFRLRRERGWRLMLRIQIGLAVLLAPMTLLFFDGASLLAPLANLVAVPVFTLLTPVALGSVLLVQGVPEGGKPLLQAVAFLLAQAWEALAFLGSQGGGWITAVPPLAAGLMALYGAVLVCLPRGLPLRPLGLVCLLPLLWPPDRAPQEGYVLTLLDVGQGLAAVIRTPQHTLLYDAGPSYEGGFDAGRAIVLPWLRAEGINRLDAVLLSHGDRDHVGGWPAVRDGLPVGQIWGEEDGPPCQAGQRWVWEGVEFETLHPEVREVPLDRLRNEDSCVLRVAYRGRVSLLTGDIERRAEAQLVRLQGERLRAQVLVAPHHGSRTSSTPNFVAAVQPRWVLYPAGWRHHYGHPHPEVERRYALQGATAVSSGRHGTLTVTWDEDGEPSVQASREVQRRRWQGGVVP